MTHNFANGGVSRSMTDVRLVAGDVSLGAACRVFELTPRAVHYYEEQGLIATTRDSRNRRRLDALAHHRLKWISRLRKAGIALRSIRAMFRLTPRDLDIAEVALALLAERGKVLAAELQYVDELILDLQRNDARESLNRRAS